MNIHKAKMYADLLNLAISPIKQLKILNKIQLIYIQMEIYIQMDIIVPWTWGQHIIALININYNKNDQKQLLSQIYCAKLPFLI